MENKLDRRGQQIKQNLRMERPVVNKALQGSERRVRFCAEWSWQMKRQIVEGRKEQVITHASRPEDPANNMYI